MSVELKWIDPPVEGRGGPNGKTGKWRATAAALRDRPGEWALVSASTTKPGAAALAVRLRRGHLGGWTVGSFEVRTHTPKDGPYHVYARFVG